MPIATLPWRKEAVPPGNVSDLHFTLIQKRAVP